MVKKWVLKAVVQKTISYLPFKHRINYLFQKYVTKGVELSDNYFYDRLNHAKHHLEHFTSVKNRSPQVVLELGTGWYPVVPLIYYLCGAEKIISVDIAPLMTLEKLHVTIKRILKAIKEDKIKKEFFPFLDVERIERLKEILTQNNFEECLKVLRIEYIVGDIIKTKLPDQSVGFISSNNTFEHVYTDSLVGILKEFKRIIKPGGAMSHFIDMSDHFAHMDNKITTYNFLRFTESEWKWIDNSIQPMNRLRINNYREIYWQLSIPVSKEINYNGKEVDLEKVRLAEPFSSYKKEDLLVSHSYFVSYF